MIINGATAVRASDCDQLKFSSSADKYFLYKPSNAGFMEKTVSSSVEKLYLLKHLCSV